MSYVTRKYHDKKIKAKDARIAELEKDVAFWRDKAPEEQEAKIRELQRNLDYYKQAHAKECEAHNEVKAKQNRDMGMIEGVSNKRREAAHRAHDELSKVKANETCEVRLQRAIGNAQGILAAVIDHCPGMVLYPEDLPPRRRAGDMPMTATEVMRRQRGMY